MLTFGILNVKLRSNATGVILMPLAMEALWASHCRPSGVTFSISGCSPLGHKPREIVAIRPYVPFDSVLIRPKYNEMK